MSNEKDLKSNEKSSIINSFQQVKLVYLVYYTLSFIVLFFKIFTRSDNTYRIGLFEFAQGIGWIYYLANIFGLATVFVKPLKSIEVLSAKVISVINLVISLILLLKTIPDAMGFSQNIIDYLGEGSIASGFWIILLLHLVAVIVFWFKFIKSRIEKSKAKNKA